MTPRYNPAVIIPMAGHSSRFFNSGFDTYKAFLKIAGKTMLEGVIEPFGQNVDIFIITTKELVAENTQIFSAMPHNYKVITIKKHKLGPAYSIYSANDLIPKNRPYFIAYCDVWWRMEGFHISNFNGIDAAILTHEGFHPHLVADNFSAFCCAEEKNRNHLRKIKEKGSFTDDWMNEALSIGVFYCRDATLMLNTIAELIESEEKVADEFYPSMIYNHLVDRGINVSLFNVDSFVHLGLPQHFNDIQSWSSYINKTDNILETSSPLNCVLLGGKGSRMKNISPLPKHLLPLADKTMLEHVLKKMNCVDNILICAPDTQLPLGLSEKVSVKELDENTSSHLETMELALDFLPIDTPVLFSSCDCFADIDWINLETIASASKSDCIVFSFSKSLLNSKVSGQHTAMKTIDGSVVDVDIKGKTKHYDSCLAGFFWFRNKEIVSNGILKLRHADEKIELLVDHLIQSLSKSEKKPQCIKLDSYIHVGTPEEYKEYLYWNTRAKPLISLLNVEGSDV